VFPVSGSDLSKFGKYRFDPIIFFQKICIDIVKTIIVLLRKIVLQSPSEVAMQQTMFTKKQIQQALTGIVDIKEREVGYWTDLGIVVPAIANPTGRGYTRFYSFDNLVELAVAKRMANAGLNLKALKSVMQELRNSNLGDATWLGYIRVVVGNPNSQEVVVTVQMVAKQESKCALDMSDCDTYFVFDVTATIKAVYGLLV
jgi:DNA-binding transcriptional MerR regulator